MTWIQTFVLLLGTVLTIGSGIYTWKLESEAKREQQAYLRKEQQYQQLISSIQGFYVSAQSDGTAVDLKGEFIRELNHCYLYCPDPVILAANHFLDTVSVGAKNSEEEQKRAFARLILALRVDLYGETSLSEDDYLHVRPTR